MAKTDKILNFFFFIELDISIEFAHIQIVECVAV